MRIRTDWLFAAAISALSLGDYAAAAPDVKRGAATPEEIASAFIQAAGARDESAVQALLVPPATCPTAPEKEHEACTQYLAALERGVPGVIPTVPKNARAASVVCENKKERQGSTLYLCQVTTENDQIIGVMSAAMDGRAYLMFGLPREKTSTALVSKKHPGPPPAFELKTVEAPGIGCRVKVPNSASHTDPGRWEYQWDPRGIELPFSVYCYPTKAVTTLEEAIALYRIPRGDTPFTAESLPNQRFRLTVQQDNVHEIFVFGARDERGIQMFCSGPELEGVKKLCAFLEILPAGE